MSALPTLSDLLAESISSVKQDREAIESRKRLARGGQSTAEREADAARIREWENKHEWEGAANVALFHIYSCSCGNRFTLFEGMFERQTHRHLKHGAQRHIAVTSAKASLPNETATRASDVEACGQCMIGKGWDLTNSAEWEC